MEPLNVIVLVLVILIIIALIILSVSGNNKINELTDMIKSNSELINNTKEEQDKNISKINEQLEDVKYIYDENAIVIFAAKKDDKIVSNYYCGDDKYFSLNRSSTIKIYGYMNDDNIVISSSTGYFSYIELMKNSSKYATEEEKEIFKYDEDELNKADTYIVGINSKYGFFRLNHDVVGTIDIAIVKEDTMKEDLVDINDVKVLTYPLYVDIREIGYNKYNEADKIKKSHFKENIDKDNDDVNVYFTKISGFKLGVKRIAFQIKNVSCDLLF